MSLTHKETDQRNTDEALLRKSPDERGSPFPGRTYPTTSVTEIPRAA